MNLWPQDSSTQEKVAFLKRLLMGWRFPLTDEKQTQAKIEEALSFSMVPFVREHELGDAGKIDFMVDGNIGIEVKIKGAKMAIYRQCERYCKRDEITHFMLFSLVPMALPKEIEGKPATFVHMGTAFLR